MEYRAVSRTPSIYHYGVLGMKWGHRKNPDKNRIALAAYDDSGFQRTGVIKSSKVGKIKKGINKHGRKEYVNRQTKKANRSMSLSNVLLKGVTPSTALAGMAVGAALANPIPAAILGGASVASMLGSAGLALKSAKANANASVAANGTEEVYDKWEKEAPKYGQKKRKHGQAFVYSVSVPG